MCRGPDHNRGETLLPCQFLSSILADWSRWHLCLLANYSFLFWKKRKNICFEMLRPSVSYNTHLFWCGRYNRRANEWSCRNDENISTRSPSFLGAMPYIQLIFPPPSLNFFIKRCISAANIPFRVTTGIIRFLPLPFGVGPFWRFFHWIASAKRDFSVTRIAWRLLNKERKKSWEKTSKLCRCSREIP